MTELAKMINDIIAAIRAAGGTVPDGADVSVEISIRQRYRGEAPYIAGPSRQLRARQLASLEQMKLRDMAVATGLSVRTIKRIRNGR